MKPGKWLFFFLLAGFLPAFLFSVCRFFPAENPLPRSSAWYGHGLFPGRLAAGRAGDDAVRVEVQAVLLPPGSHSPLVVLADLDGERYLPIGVGPCEALAIRRGLDGPPPERPLTHDLLKSVIESLEGKLAAITVNRFEKNTFFAELLVTAADGETVLIDARPSDSIALAVRFETPLFVTRDVFDAAGVSAPGGLIPRGDREEIRGII